MKQDERAPFVSALETARVEAYAPGEFVGQESFMTAGGIRSLAAAAGVGRGTRVLDLCCGIAGPGRLITAETGCSYLGVDHSASALSLARSLAAARKLACRFEIAHLPPIPASVGPADVVLLLETILAFPDKDSLLASVARALGPGGRFALTLEEGRPLDASERAAMPDADTVHLVELSSFTSLLESAGFGVTWIEDVSAAHRAVALALLDSLTRHRSAIADQIGGRALADLLALHDLWATWLGTGRVRKFALVASQPPAPEHL